MVADAAHAARLLRERHPGVPFYLMGESMGAAVAILAAIGGAEIDGLILVAPAVRGHQMLTVAARAALVPRACIARMIAELPPQTRHLQRVALYREGYHMLLRDRRAGVVLADIA